MFLAGTVQIGWREFNTISCTKIRIILVMVLAYKAKNFRNLFNSIFSLG